MPEIQEPNTNSLTDPALLERIDKLFACNVGEYVALPQLIAVGDQSSGKSSILEGLTKLPFPRDSNFCTRFATQIIFRRAVGQVGRRIKASIIPAPHTSSDNATRLKLWTRTMSGTLQPQKFSDMIQQVHTVMGVRTLEDQIKPTFSRHVFRLEIIGPDEDHLSVIDVPGIFKSVTPGVTTKNDIEMVRSMVLEYMKSTRSIILAVVPANVDIATQEIIERARDADPEGQRTLGVLTKPDLVDRGAERNVLDLIDGKSMPLRHGWVLVRNLGKSELAHGEYTREELEEDLRKKDGWNSIPDDRFGIEALRHKLKDTVTENARREFPKVRMDVSKKLKEARAALQALGHERVTRQQQVDFLLDIVSRFNEIRADALKGNYGTDDIFDKVQRFRLATTVIGRNEQFKADMTHLGHVYRFHRHEIMEGQGEYSSSRGFEMGTFNTSLLPAVMKKQSTKWEKIALGYVADIIAVVDAFITDVLVDLCPNPRTYRGLLSIVSDSVQKKYMEAVEHTQFLLESERNDTLMTLHQSVMDTAQDRPELRMQKLIADKTFHAGNHALGKVIRVEDVKAALPGQSSRDVMVRQIHDILESYYHVAQSRFVDNVCVQSANYFLLAGPKSPMKVLSPTFVYRLTDAQLEDIAGEDPTVHKKRIEAMKVIEELEGARRILL
ncbi:P-loop containing nucleoside triphosphate hydrolase protein [Aspergillus cavernicola]|uniref:P-loop containing nucleoside triphosphate hydrolase protein n=1 Tax=Aspergillus cavernicola TaxID=176166 RepID=A0ABR4HPU1_9EURO